MSTSTVVIDSTAQMAASVAAQDGGAPVTVIDSAINIGANLDSLETLAAAGQLASISFTDTGFAILPISAGQLTSDASALAELRGNFVVEENADAANVTITGLPGHGNIVLLPNPANDYSVTVPAKGASFVLTDLATGRVSSDSLTNVNALQFSDRTVIIATTPGTGTVTDGNLTELYGAVLARQPDVPGLAYYDAILSANPTLPLTVFATWFLQSPEYLNNSAHNYAQTAAGDALFITACYNNLLNRAPEAAAIPYYAAIITQITLGQTPGTAGFTAAELQAHATVLVDFSASTEFLSDVQITAAHPGDATHWLILV